MTNKEYQDSGFRLSLQIEQKDIDRAESEVTRAYVSRIAPDLDIEDSDYRYAVMSLAYLWLLQHSAFATRAGAKMVNITSAQNVSDYDVLRGAAYDAHASMVYLREKVGDENANILDICRIYFSTNYFGL